MSWILLIIGLFEVGFASCLSKNETKLNLLIGCWAFFCLSISMLLLYKATQELPIGTAYAVWTGIELWEPF
jgi:quaternary ammonium compound-resistance protein SugE